MGGQLSARDYFASAYDWVDTGADLPIVGIIRTPEAKLLDAQREENVLHARALIAQREQAAALGAIHGELRHRHPENRDVAGEMTAAMRDGFGGVASVAARGLGRVQGEIKDLHTTVRDGFEQVDTTLKIGFEQVDDSINQGFKQVDGSINQGFEQVDGSINQGFEQVDGSINRGFEQVDGSINQGFERVDSTLNGRFEGVCRGLGVIDRDLVSGFDRTTAAVNQQTEELGERLRSVEDSIVGSLSMEGSLTRDAVRQVGTHFVHAMQREGQATREGIAEATEMTIAQMAEEGILTRAELTALREAIHRNANDLRECLHDLFEEHSELLSKGMAGLSRDLSRQGELKSREHTRVALGYFQHGLMPEARAALKAAMREYRGYFPALFLDGLIAAMGQDFRGAERCLANACAMAGVTDPASKRAQLSLATLMLGRIAIAEERWRDADDVLGKLGDADPSFLAATIEQAFAIYHNPARGELRARLELITAGLDKCGERQGRRAATYVWFGFALLMADDHPEDAVSALKRGLKYGGRTCEDRLTLYRVLRGLYPGHVKFLFKAILEHAPQDLSWVVG